jgi:DegV family protein with EDD domain
MAGKIGIVTDSTAYLPKKIMDKYPIGIAPAVVIWSGEEYRDGVDIQPAEFYKRLATAQEMPTTSQPSPAAVKEAVDKLAAQGYTDILAIMISEKLSGTLASTRQAKDMLSGINMEIVDTKSASMGAGWQVLAAAEAAAKGKSLKESKAAAENARGNTGVLLSVDTLEFLHRGGRIGGAQRFIGTALNFKPILEVQDGAIEALERVRTRSKALKRLVELTVERVAGRTPVYLAAIHANAPDTAAELLEMAKAELDLTESVISDVSPAVGTHTGPGTVGLCYMAGVKV